MVTAPTIERSSAPPPSTPALFPTPTPIVTDPAKEYIAGGSQGWGTFAAPHALPWYGDDVMRDFGLDLYVRMARDPQVHKALHVFVKSVLSSALTVQPPIALDQDSPRYPLAVRISEFSNRNLNNLPTPFLTILNELVTGALQQGHKIAERIYKQDKYDSKARSTQWVLRDLKCRPLDSYAWVVDPYNNVLGLLAQQPGRPIIANSVIVTNNNAAGSPLIEYGKVAHLVWAPQNGDPRGTSHLRQVYMPWWGKQQAIAQVPKYVARFGQPSLDGELAPNAGDLPQLNTDGSAATPLTPQQAFADSLQTMIAGGWIVRPNGSKLNVLEPKGDGNALYNAISLFDQQIIGGMTYQELATDQGEFSSRAQSATQQDVMELLFLFGKRWVSAFVRDLLRPLVEMNYGAANLDLLPDVHLGETQPHDMPQIMQALAQLNAGGEPWITDQQKPWWDARIGAPPRSRRDTVTVPTPAPTVPAEAP